MSASSPEQPGGQAAAADHPMPDDAAETSAKKDIKELALSFLAHGLHEWPESMPYEEVDARLKEIDKSQDIQDLVDTLVELINSDRSVFACICHKFASHTVWESHAALLTI